jgi:uncharacterized membrane protein YagU involved in acid resistance
VLSKRQLRWQTLVAATLAAAVADAAFAFVAYVLVAGRYNFESLLQYIASGLAGHAAFASGWAGVGYPVLGFAIHLALSAGFVVVFAVAFAPHIRSRRAAVISGLAYGVAIWLFMNAVVLPLGRSAHERFFDAYYIAYLIDHALLVGLPIALILTAGVHRATNGPDHQLAS